MNHPSYLVHAQHSLCTCTRLLSCAVRRHVYLLNTLFLRSTVGALSKASQFSPHSCLPSDPSLPHPPTLLRVFRLPQTKAEGSNLYGQENSIYPVLETYAEGGILEVKITVSTYHDVRLFDISVKKRCSTFVSRCQTALQKC